MPEYAAYFVKFGEYQQDIVYTLRKLYEEYNAWDLMINKEMLEYVVIFDFIVDGLLT